MGSRNGRRRDRVNLESGCCSKDFQKGKNIRSTVDVTGPLVSSD